MRAITLAIICAAMNALGLLAFAILGIKGASFIVAAVPGVILVLLSAIPFAQCKRAYALEQQASAQAAAQP